MTSTPASTIIAAVAAEYGRSPRALLSKSQRPQVIVARRAAAHRLRDAGYDPQAIAAALKHSVRRIHEELRRPVEASAKTCAQCGREYPLSSKRTLGSFCSARCKGQYEEANDVWGKKYLPRHLDRIDCAFYNANPKHDVSKQTWRDGCLYEAARANRPSVCLRLCRRYTPQAVELSNPLQSSMGSFVDEFSDDAI